MSKLKSKLKLFENQIIYINKMSLLHYNMFICAVSQLPSSGEEKWYEVYPNIEIMQILHKNKTKKMYVSGTSKVHAAANLLKWIYEDKQAEHYAVEEYQEGEDELEEYTVPGIFNEIEDWGYDNGISEDEFNHENIIPAVMGVMDEAEKAVTESKRAGKRLRYTPETFLTEVDIVGDGIVIE